jgi:hypothetical protein
MLVRIDTFERASQVQDSPALGTSRTDHEVEISAVDVANTSVASTSQGIPQ